MGSANEAFNIDYAQHVKAGMEASRQNPKRVEGALL
jgi:hypothetical protein